MRTLGWLGMAILLAGCGPVYETNYRFTPPADPMGRACISQCGTAQSQCRDNTNLRAENSRLRCERDARDDYERCLGNASGDQGRNACQRRSCSESTDYSLCDNDYRVCFQSCGGAVQTERLCTFNCP